MGLLSNKISRDKLKPGDHIYSWRKAYTYSHHGIYVGDEKVIHFTRAAGPGSGSGSLLDKYSSSSLPHQNNSCPNCGDQSKLHGVISSCLDCFLAGGNLYLFEYSVSRFFFIAKQRGGTCTTATSDPCDEVIYRAEFLLSRNGFGAYHLLENNCEDFATYCKTGLVVESKIKQGSSGQASSGQANSASAARNGFSFTVGFLGVMKTRAAPKVTGIKGVALVGTYRYGKYCYDRLCSDIGRRSDVIKVSVKTLVFINENLEGRLEQNKESQ